VVLQRDASQQTKYGKEVTTEYEFDKLKPGDLLFYGRAATDSATERVGHVAIYVGDGNFIHSSGKVRINSMDSSRGNYIADYKSIFVRASRMKDNFDNFGVQKIKDNNFYKEIINDR
jgi:cell wall-associated NlpC family hydrolase